PRRQWFTTPASSHATRTRRLITRCPAPACCANGASTTRCPTGASSTGASPARPTRSSSGPPTSGPGRGRAAGRRRGLIVVAAIDRGRARQLVRHLPDPPAVPLQRQVRNRAPLDGLQRRLLRRHPPRLLRRPDAVAEQGAARP